MDEFNAAMLDFLKFQYEQQKGMKEKKIELQK